MSEAAQIAEILRSYRFPLGREKDTQAAIATVLKNEGVAFEREVKLDDGDIVDFMCGAVGVEVKLNAQRMALLRQCERQALDPRIAEHLLVTNVATGWPADLNGKPAYFVNLAAAWM